MLKIINNFQQRLNITASRSSCKRKPQTIGPRAPRAQSNAIKLDSEQTNSIRIKKLNPTSNVPTSDTYLSTLPIEVIHITQIRIKSP